MFSIAVGFQMRVIRGRVVVWVDDAPPRVIGRVVSCPCCGFPQFAEA